MNKAKKAGWIVALAIAATTLGYYLQSLGDDWAVWDSEKGVPDEMLIPLVILFLMFSARVLAIGANGKVNMSNWVAYCIFAFMGILLLIGAAWVVDIESWGA
jgi:amino acid transporter